MPRATRCAEPLELSSHRPFQVDPGWYDAYWLQDHAAPPAGAARRAIGALVRHCRGMVGRVVALAAAGANSHGHGRPGGTEEAPPIGSFH